MAEQKRAERPRRAQGQSGPKTETLTLRLDPRTRFMIELAALAWGRSITSVVERSVRNTIDRLEFDRKRNPKTGEIEGKNWKDFWHINEGVRRIRLVCSEDFRKNSEDEELFEFICFHIEFFSEIKDIENIDPIRSEILWPFMGDLLTIWRNKTEGLWAAGDKMVDILQAAGVRPPRWPRDTTTPYGPDTGGTTDDLDDEIPF